MFLSTRTGVAAGGWAGACFAGGCATSLGIGGTYTKVPGAIGPRCADEFHRTPKEIAAVQARFQMAARRRNKPLPTLPPPSQRPARSARRPLTAWATTPTPTSGMAPDARQRLAGCERAWQLRFRNRRRARKRNACGPFERSDATSDQFTCFVNVTGSISTRRFGSRHLISAGRFFSSLHSTTGSASPLPTAVRRVPETPLPSR
jgi:hypothetical protein